MMPTKEQKAKMKKVGIHELAKRSGIPFEDLNSLVDFMCAALVAGETVQLTNFGTFSRHTYPARTYDRSKMKGAAIAPGIVVDKPERDTVRFKISEDLRVKLDPTFTPRWKKQEKTEREQVESKISTPKLTADQVIEIRSRTNPIATELAEEFGVQAQTIRKVLTGKTWRHLLREG